MKIKDLNLYVKNRTCKNNNSYKSGSIIIIFISIIFSLNHCTDKKTDTITPSELRCDYWRNPPGTENSSPKLSWILNSSKRNQIQTAYHVLVSSSLENLNNDNGDLWNSKKIRSDKSIHISYEGEKLESGKRYYWKVRVWDKHGKKSEWSAPAYWETGLIKKEDWQARWIGFESDNAPMFRKEFEINQSVREARIYISGIGYYELSINGSRIGDNVLDPGQTDYEQRTFYVIYDVTENIKAGSNVIGIMLGNGWYNQTSVNHGRYGWTDVAYGQPRLIFQMRLIFADGSHKLILSDETWKASGGPIISNNIYAGEEYDARLEQNGWNEPGFNDNNWESAKEVESPGGRLVWQNIPPIKKMHTITPVKILNPEPGVFIYDMGQNFAGWARLKIKAPEGTEIKLRFAEWLGKDGMIDPGSTGVYATGVVQTDKYTCGGKDIELWEPRFTYHGFQYVEMTGFPGKPTMENIEGIVVHTSLEKAGKFECSDSILNKLHKTALWTEISNLHGIPTDCPHRERCGWLGDNAILTTEMVIYNFEAPTFWSKFINDIETSRDGGLPYNIAPGRRRGGEKAPDWGAGFVHLTWNMFLYYGDKSIINEHYEGMSYFMDHLQKTAVDYIIYNGIGSLFPPGRIMPLETPKEFTSTLLYFSCADMMARMAHVTGRKEDEAKYLSIKKLIKSSFNNKFYSTSGKTYGGQEKNTLALAYGLVPDNDEKAVAENLNKDVKIHKGHIFSGVFGSRYIYYVLAKYGYEETVMNMFNLNTFPSYGYLFSRGATTFWENWGELKFEDRPLARGDDRSKSHPFQGGFDAWFYNGIAGINPDPDNPGFKHIIFSPQLVSTLDHASATYNSIHGLITSKWQNTDDEFKWEISLPANTSATVYLPTDSKDLISEGNTPASQADGVSFLGLENNHSLFEIGSGIYTFTVSKKTKF